MLPKVTLWFPRVNDPALNNVLRNSHDQAELRTFSTQISSNNISRLLVLRGSRRRDLSIFETLIFRVLKFEHLVFAVPHSRRRADGQGTRGWLATRQRLRLYMVGRRAAARYENSWTYARPRPQPGAAWWDLGPPV
jgi:hypothetical protein